jgi:hypothetical protein
MSRDRWPAALGLCGLLALPAFTPAQPDAKPADLPVTRTVLYSSGVGYYQRDGQVTDTARIDLSFPESAVNDLLKSLTLQDAGGGRVSAVSYDNRNPVERTLKSFAIDLTSNPSIGQLLGQVRGERVDLTAATSGAMTGLIVGVEKTHQPTEKGGASEAEQLNLLTANGLQGVPLPGVKRIRFVKPE